MRYKNTNKTMITVVLPDGTKKSYENASALKVAEDISPRLASAAIAAKIDGTLCDISTPLTDGEHTVSIITSRDGEALEILRHTAAHTLADAMVRLYGPDVKYCIGPALVNDFQYGFYYDFDLPEHIGPDDLPKIEAEMKKIVAEKQIGRAHV